MSAATTDPKRLPDALERPQPIADVPLWSENMCFTGWDPERGIGLWSHTGRTAYDPELWHEIVVVHLPDGTDLVAKNYSRSATGEHHAGDLLRCRCEEPFARWSIVFDGPVRRVPDRDLRTGTLRDGPGERRARLDLAFTSDRPTWHFGGAGDWARTHYQQLGRYTGTLRHDGEEVALALTGWRDHSVGARDLAPFERHTLVTAQLEDGRSLYAVELVDERPGHSASFARLGDGTAILEAEPLELPPIDDTHGPSDTYTFSLATPDGPRTVGVRMLCDLAVTMFAPNDMVVGLSTAPGAYVLWMGQARFELDGVTGYGHVERAGRVATRHPGG